jgi:phage repressor protein C with HTH and peptisase S24 domain
MVQELADMVPDYSDVNRSRCFLHVVNLVAKALIKQFDAVDAIPSQSVANSTENNTEDATENTAESTAESTTENDVEDNSEAEDDADLESEIIETALDDDKDSDGNNTGGEDSDGKGSDGKDQTDLDDPDDATNPSVLGAEEQEALNIAIQPVRLVLAKVSCSA